jgi:RNA polymerase sigma-70 factor (ECF subfamily)
LLRLIGGEACRMAEPSPALVSRAQAGDRQALAELIQSQQSYVYSIAMSLMHNPADAADMTQEAFIRLMRSLGTYRGETRFTTWLYRLVTNICLDGLRRRGRPVESLDEAVGEDDAATRADRLVDADRWAQPDEQLRFRESAAEVRAALAQLPAPQRLALTLHYFEDMRYEEIATVMGLPLNTVKSHIRRGKERMATLLAQYEDDRKDRTCTATT